jgi:hypothetical protein
VPNIGINYPIGEKMPEELLYIGTKFIKAYRMTAHQFAEYQNRPAGEDAEGYYVRYADGYESWSPKDIFERSYRVVSDQEKQMFQ